MGVGTRFQLVLFLAFSCLVYLQYRDASTTYDLFLKSQARSFESSQQSLAPDLNGQQAFDVLAANQNFLFFQFIDPEDSTRNFTHGRLNDGMDPVLDRLFPDKNRYKLSLPNTSLQVVIDRPPQITLLLQQLIFWVLVYTVIYITISVMFIRFIAALKSHVKYASNYIEELPKLQFSPVENSKLGPLLKPIGASLMSCKHELKEQLDSLSFENDQLQKVAYHDYLTGFGTSKKFSSLLDRLSQDQSSRLGVIAQIKATELAFINKEKGHEAGDNYLLDVVNSVKHHITSQADAECFRVNATTFAIYLPDLSLAHAKLAFEKVTEEFKDIQPKYLTDSIAYTALVPCETGGDPTTVLNLMDTAITIALTQSANTVFIMESAPDDINAGEHQWQQVIATIIENQTIDFLQQPIQPCREGPKTYTELLARFYNESGNILPTQTVLAMAARYELSSKLDQAIITSVLQLMESMPSLSDNIGININGASISDSDFLSWLKATLIQRKEIATRLVFEVSETDMESHLLAASRFVRLIHALGAKVSVEQFGHGFTSFKFFREVAPDFIKLDASYSHHIDENANNRFYVRSLVDIARRVSVQVLASAVERKEEKMELEKLHVDGVQGFYIARPNLIQVRKAAV